MQALQLRRAHKVARHDERVRHVLPVLCERCVCVVCVSEREGVCVCERCV